MSLGILQAIKIYCNYKRVTTENQTKLEVSLFHDPKHTVSQQASSCVFFYNLLSSLDSKLCMTRYCIDLHCANPSMLSEFLMYSSYLRMLTKDTHARHFGLHKIFSMELLPPTTLVSFPPPEHIPWFIPSPRLSCFLFLNPIMS